MSEKKCLTFEDELNAHGVLVFPNKGSSMMPMLREDRDLMIIKRKEGRCRKYDAVLFKRTNGQYVLHRILKVSADSYYIVGDNCAAGEWVRDEQVLGVLDSFVRDGRKIGTDDGFYKLYVHLWCDLFFVRRMIIRMRMVAGRLWHLLKD